MAIKYHQCVSCLGLVELFGVIVLCEHRTDLETKHKDLKVPCDCPTQYDYVPPSHCTRATCEEDWDVNDEESWELFESRIAEIDEFYKKEENK